MTPKSFRLYRTVLRLPDGRDRLLVGEIETVVRERRRKRVIIAGVFHACKSCRIDLVTICQKPWEWPVDFAGPVHLTLGDSLEISMEIEEGRYDGDPIKPV